MRPLNTCPIPVSAVANRAYRGNAESPPSLDIADYHHAIIPDKMHDSTLYPHRRPGNPHPPFPRG